MTKAKRIGGTEAMEIIDAKCDEHFGKLPVDGIGCCLPLTPDDKVRLCTDGNYNIKEAGKVSKRLHAISIQFE